MPLERVICKTPEYLSRADISTNEMSFGKRKKMPFYRHITFFTKKYFLQITRMIFNFRKLY